MLDQGLLGGCVEASGATTSAPVQSCSSSPTLATLVAVPGRFDLGESDFRDVPLSRLGLD